MEKICFVTTVPLTLRAFVIDTAKYLHDQGGYDISFICDNDPDFAASLPEYIHYHPVPMKRGISLGGIGAMLKMYRIFRKENFNLVQYSTPNASLYASMAAWLAGVKHRKYHLMGFRYLGFTGIKKYIFSTVEKLCCSLSTDIECVSASNMELGIRDKIFPAKKAHVLFHGSSAGVDLTIFDISKKAEWRAQLRKQFNLADRECVFGFAGRITRDKGINELISAFRNLNATNSRLLIIGQHENEDELDLELWQWAKSCDNVVIHPFVNDIQRYFAAMDVLILPSYREGFGNIVIEAQAMGIPVIVSDIPGPVDAMIPQETGLVVPVKDSYALMQAMATLSCDSTMRSFMGVNGRQFVEKYFDSKKVILAAYNELDRALSSDNVC